MRFIQTLIALFKSLFLYRTAKKSVQKQIEHESLVHTVLKAQQIQKEINQVQEKTDVQLSKINQVSDAEVKDMLARQFGHRR